MSQKEHVQDNHLVRPHMYHPPPLDEGIYESVGQQDMNSKPIFNEELQGISRLLGIDGDQYLLQHTDRYEALKKKWTDCSLDEWKGGVDGAYHPL